MMKYDRAFSREEGRLLAAALKARQFRRPLPPGMGERLQARIRAAEGGGARWWKVAASVAAVASFAAFATTVAVKFAGGEDKTAEPGAFAEAAEVAAEETFEEIFSEELAELKKQEEEQAMNTRAVKGLAAGALVAATAFTVPSAQGAVRSSVFDDVKVWYKGSAGNAVGTADSSGNQIGKMKNLPQLADTSSSSMHGDEYYWWGWRMSYENQKVVCPYANVTLDSTPCMVVRSPVTTNSTEIVTIDNVEQEQPNITYRTGTLQLKKWFTDRTADCSNYTLFLRFRNEAINPLPGTQNRPINIGAVWTDTAGAAAGIDFRMVPTAALSEYSVPRFVVGKNQDAQYDDIRIKDGVWVDCVITVDGSTVSTTFCYEKDGVPVLKRCSTTYPTSGPQPSVKPNATVLIGGNNSASCTFTRGVGLASGSSWTYGFRGAFHQIAFWNRTLSDNEIREAMAGGTSRPNLVQVGIEGNGINEFAATPTKTSVATDGDWENLNPTLTVQNPSATITFNCPALWAGLPQYLRLPMAGTSSSGAVNITLNGMPLGIANVYPNKTSLVYVEENKITSGANTLVITHASGDALVLDAVTLGGSWKFGESVTSFNDAAVNANTAAKVGADCWVFNPACGNDKFHARGTTWSINGDTLSFPVFMPKDLVGKVRGELLFKTATAANGCQFRWLVNGTEILSVASGGPNTQYTCNVNDGAFVDGWNNIVWNRQSNWINFSTFQFTVLPPVKGMMIIIK